MGEGLRTPGFSGTFGTLISTVIQPFLRKFSFSIIFLSIRIGRNREVLGGLAPNPLKIPTLPKQNRKICRTKEYQALFWYLFASMSPLHSRSVFCAYICGFHLKTKKPWSGKKSEHQSCLLSPSNLRFIFTKAVHVSILSATLEGQISYIPPALYARVFDAQTN